MSAYEDDAGMAGDELARMVNEGKLTDLEALRWLSRRDPEVDAKIDRILADEAASTDTTEEGR